MFAATKSQFNYLDESNLPIVVSATSKGNGTWILNNLFNSNDKKLWLSTPGLPQSFTLNLSLLKNKAVYHWFGIKCQFAYASNPKNIELYVSRDGANYVLWSSHKVEYKDGTQFWDIDSITKKYIHLKIVIKSTYGANQTYLNQIYLCEENPNGLVPIKQPKTVEDYKTEYIEDLENDVSSDSKLEEWLIKSPGIYNETENGTMTARDLIQSEVYKSKRGSVRTSMEDPPQPISNSTSLSNFEAYKYKNPELRTKMISLAKDMKKIKKKVTIQDNPILSSRLNNKHYLLLSEDEKADIEFTHDLVKIKSQMSSFKDSILNLQTLFSNCISELSDLETKMIPSDFTHSTTKPSFNVFVNGSVQ